MGLFSKRIMITGVLEYNVTINKDSNFNNVNFLIHKLNGKLMDESLQVRIPVTLYNNFIELSDDLKKDALLKIKAEKEKNNHRFNFVVASIMKTCVNDNELEELLEERKKDVIVPVIGIGDFVMNRENSLNNSIFKEIDVNSNKVIIKIEWNKDMSIPSERFKIASSTVRGIEGLDRMIKEEACKQLIDLRNCEWSINEKDVVSINEFKDNLVLTDIIVRNDNTLYLEYYDSEMFGGHRIHVEFDSNNEIKTISL